MESKTERAISQIHAIEDEASRNTWIHNVHPLIKLLVTVAFLGVLISFGKYNLTGVILFSLYPFILFAMSTVSFGACMRRIWPVLPLFFFIGIANVFYEREAAFAIGAVGISYGVLSLAVLMMKGVLSVMATYLLIATTGIDGICYALRVIHVPKIIVTEILLIYRYFSVLAAEAGELATAYRLRAPGHRGIALPYAGSFLGQLLLRSVDRAEDIYAGMELRGFQGEFYLKREPGPLTQGIIYGIICVAIFAAARIIV